MTRKRIATQTLIFREFQMCDFQAPSAQRCVYQPNTFFKHAEHVLRRRQNTTQYGKSIECGLAKYAQETRACEKLCNNRCLEYACIHMRPIQYHQTSAQTLTRNESQHTARM